VEATVRRLAASDAAVYRELRLRALRTEPTAFASTAEAEERRTVAEIVPRIASAESFVVGAFDPVTGLLGLGGFYREAGPKMRHIGWIWGMFVAPEFRGRGLAARILASLIADAGRVPGIQQLQLRVVSTNAAAQRLYESAGFKCVALLPRALCVDGVFYDDVLMVRAMPRAPS
jgi:RimJ/RimL family protein N-acetyltransferase